MLEILEQVFHKASPPPQTKPLAALLERLEIEPFDTKAVEEYKKEALNTAMAVETRKRYEQGFRDIFSGAPQAAVRNALATSFPIETVLGTPWMDAEVRCFQRYGEYPIMFALKWFRTATITNWPGSGDKELPDFVRNKVCQITNEIPGVTFETDTLRSAERGYDPFLIVKLDDEEYYIEVWGDDDKPFQR